MNAQTAGQIGERGELRALAAIVESSDDAIIGKTLEGAVTSWNPAVCRHVWLYR